MWPRERRWDLERRGRHLVEWEAEGAVKGETGQHGQW